MGFSGNEPHPRHGALESQCAPWVKVLDEILRLDFDVVIPGHGRLLTKENVRSDRQKFVAMNQRMTDLVRRGVPKDKVFDELRLGDLGWDHSVSTVAFKGGLSGYYDEMKAQLPK